MRTEAARAEHEHYRKENCGENVGITSHKLNTQESTANFFTFHSVDDLMVEAVAVVYITVRNLQMILDATIMSKFEIDAIYGKCTVVFGSKKRLSQKR
jgi:hypothetical protein